MPLRTVESLQLGQLLGALLTAIVEAQQQTTRASLDFVEQVGFAGGADERLRTVQFRYRKLDENQQPAEYVVEVPLIAMVSIPTLAVSTAKVAFSYDVVSAVEEEGEGEGPRPIRPIFDRLGTRPVKLTGVVNRPKTSGNARITGDIDVEVTLQREDPPLGIARLLDLAELAIGEPAAPG